MADIQFKASRTENIGEARRWLEKAIAMEKEGKSVKMIDMALDRACAFEAHAFTLPK